MNIGENIKTYRLARKFSRKDLAEKIGVSESTISRYENNKREPNLETLLKITEALQCAPMEIIPFDVFENKCEESEANGLSLDEIHTKKFLIEIKQMLDQYFELKPSDITIVHKIIDLISYEIYKVKNNKEGE